MMPPKPKPATTTQHALDWLREAIIGGDLKPGARIRQEDVADQIGISIGPVREALRALEQEGQVTYQARRGYFVTELQASDLIEIYSLRELLESRAARAALPSLDADAIDRIEMAARDCADAAGSGDVAAELEANRRLHFGLLDSPEHPHLMRVIRQLWDSTEVYRALYYNSATERHASIDAHDRILDAMRDGDADRLVTELDAHRERALEVLLAILPN